MDACEGAWETRLPSPVCGQKRGGLSFRWLPEVSCSAEHGEVMQGSRIHEDNAGSGTAATAAAEAVCGSPWPPRRLGGCGLSRCSAARSGVASGEGQRLHPDGGAWLEVFKTPGRKSGAWSPCDALSAHAWGIGAEAGPGRGKDRARENRRAAGSWPEEAA